MEANTQLSAAARSKFALIIIAIIALWFFSRFGGRGEGLLARSSIWGTRSLPSQGGAQASPITSNLSEWAAAPDKFVFQDPQSRCLLHPDGSAEPAPGWEQDSSIPFLFDAASIPTKEQICRECPGDTPSLVCCGVCIFEGRRCDQLYPGQNKSEAAAQLLLDSGYQLRAFTPCELFQRIRGRTLWFMGDSQTWHFFYSAECFLRSFAHALRRSPPVADPRIVDQLTTVYAPHTNPPVKGGPPVCLELVLGTRVCGIRVDEAAVLMKTVLPTLQKHTPTLRNDIMIYNAGLHYPTPGSDSKPANESKLYRELAALIPWRREHRAALPSLVWMDVPIQHFSGPDGSYSGGEVPFTCKPLAAWEEGNPIVRAGGRRNIPLAPLIPQFADAWLRTWNASVPFWDSHKPGECTHWCSPSAYHMWLYLLNDVLRDSQLGNEARVAPRPSMAARAAADAAGSSGGDAREQ